MFSRTKKQRSGALNRNDEFTNIGNDVRDFDDDELKIPHY